MTVLALVGRERELGCSTAWSTESASATAGVDLAYATTGRRAQGLTKWRALVVRGEPGIPEVGAAGGGEYTRQGTGNDGTDHHGRAD
jgi:hypothetical protein